MKAVCVVGTIEYGDFILSKKILDKFHLRVYYKNISDINKSAAFISINSVYNHYIKGLKNSEELIIYGIEIPVIDILHEIEGSYYEYELAEIYIKKFTDFMFQKCRLEYDNPCEHLCFSGEDLDLLFLKTKKIQNIEDVELESLEYEESEILCLEFLLKSELKVEKNMNNNIIEKLANDLSKEIILIVAKSKYHLLSNTMNIKEGENIMLTYYIENHYVNLEINNVECSVESLNSINKTEYENTNCHRINTKWLKFLKRKLKKKYQFIEKISLNNHFEERLDI
jgi:hypothetical protein